MSRHVASCHPLGEQISELAAQLNAATCALIELIGRFDTERGWAQDGCRSCAHWLNWKCGIGLVAAREKVRVAAALDGLPKMHAAFAKGELSYSKVRAMTRVATPESEDYLMMIARHGTAAHVETVARGYRRIERRAELAQCNQAYAERSLHWRYDEDGSTVFLLRLPPEDEQRFYQAVEARREALQTERGAEGDDSAESPLRATRAEALMDLITRGHDTEVVVHVSAESLDDEDREGECHLEDGPTVAPEAARRMVHESPCNTAKGDPATILRNRHDQRGIHIDAGTAVPHWDGLPMDDGMAVEGLLQASGKLDEWG